MKNDKSLSKKDSQPKKFYLSPKITATLLALILTVLIASVNFLYLGTPAWLSYLIAINISASLLYFYDKVQAAQNKFRIPEFTLLFVLALGGDLGALIGIFKGRHKTQSDNFLAPAFIIILLHLATIIFILKYKGKI